MRQYAGTHEIVGVPLPADAAARARQAGDLLLACETEELQLVARLQLIAAPGTATGFKNVWRSGSSAFSASLGGRETLGVQKLRQGATHCTCAKEPLRRERGASRR